MSTINSDEHSAKRYVRSEREQPLAPEQRDKPGAYCISTGQLRENKGGDVKRAGAEARTSEHDRPIFMNLKTSSRRGSLRGEGRSPVECNHLGKSSSMLHVITLGSPPAPHASHCSATGLSKY